MKLTQLKVESKTLKVIALLALTFIAWPDVAFAQQTFPTQMEGEYICHRVWRPPNSAPIIDTIARYIRRDSTDATKFQASSDSTFANKQVLPMHDSIPNHFYRSTRTSGPGGSGSSSLNTGYFYPQSDSFYHFSSLSYWPLYVSTSTRLECKRIDPNALVKHTLYQVKINPNPTKSLIHINGLVQPIYYRILNLQGQILLEGEVKNGDTIQLSGLIPGLYLLQLGEAEKSVWHKVVKE